LGGANAGDGAYDYNTFNGRDWKDLATTGTNECGMTNQSPINLFTEDNAGFNYKVYEAKDDAITKDYSNLYDIEVS